MISIFKNIRTTTDAQNVAPSIVYKSIQKGQYKQQVEAIRTVPDKKTRAALKAELVCVCFSGTFSKREDGAILSHSGLAVLDFDGLSDPISKRAEMASYDFVEAAFISPSGDGLKVVVKIPADPEKHKGYYRALAKKFEGVDETSINLSRVCYISYDPDIYINLLAIDFTGYIPDAKVVSDRQYAEVEIKDVPKDFDRIARAVKMIREASDGEKHAKLRDASYLLGGCVAMGSISEMEAISILEAEISKRNIDSFPAAQKTIRNCLNEGKAKPLEPTIKYSQSTPNNPLVSTGIRPIDDVWENMKDSFKNGKKRGLTTHFIKFDENFKWKSGEITLIIARPNSGKTEFGLQLMLMKSVFDGWKWGVFSPENYPEDEFYDSLIHTYIGKTTDPFYGQHQMSLEEYEKGYQFVREHFFYVYPESHTIEEIDANFDYLIKEKKINGTFIDPFNQVTADEGPRTDQFISKFLTVRKRRAISYNGHDVISTHPRTMSRNKSGEYDVPDMYEIAGGAMWGNKMDNIMVIHRPKFLTDPMDTTVEVHVRKIKKQKLVGIPGTCVFDFKRSTNRYYIDGISPLSDGKFISDTTKNFEETTSKIFKMPLRVSESKRERQDDLDDLATQLEIIK